MTAELLMNFRDTNPPADIPISAMTASQCLDVIADADRMKSFYDARIAQALTRFAELRPPSRQGMDLADGAREEVSMELGITPQAADTQIQQARKLVTRLPATLSALADGHIDHRRAVALADLTSDLSKEDAHNVEKQVLAQGKRPSHGKFRDAVRRHTIKADADAAARRRAAARKRRDVFCRPCFDGMSELSVNLTAEDAAAVHKRIDTLAREAKTPGDTRTIGQRRADVLVDLILGEGKKLFNVTVNVTVPMTTLMGLNEHPGELSGYGPITAEHARELATNATWRRILTDPAGQVLEVSRRRHASPALADHIRLRDRYCRVPGCNVLAEDSEIDHTVRHSDQGETSAANTGAHCKYHNLWKERSPWTVDQPTPGTFTYTSPEGRTYTTEPDPYPSPDSPTPPTLSIVR
ncbi:hypothetical protein JOF56_010574 [Kibdelosporangium banguiense]|uniref:DUF222 domain-containing protein n=1 Tax=Kibdelosporangium banguiense TaxID=1365924 RepID=A0ABS4U1U2_9PSEU|nr:HNH endonuclease signature motif containing protein [Kibdelosporangium banguiense]MBP2330189.1 hypothetical protein [Kibdelosporangium banguiense]